MGSSMGESHLEDKLDLLLQRYDQLESSVLCERFDINFSNALVFMLTFFLENGSTLDSDGSYREPIDMFFTLFRNLLRKHRKNLYDSVTLLILRVIELRASRWQPKDSIEEYYQKKIEENSTKNQLPTCSSDFKNLSTIQSSGHAQSSSHEPFKSSGLRVSKSYGDVASYSAEDFRPFRGMTSSMKNCCKDEVVIKNSDSGKVMGIKGRRVHMIEEMSDTIISLQKVSLSVKDRHVQISGPSQESIEKAKSLIDLTIRQNTSPIPFTTSDYENFCVVEEPEEGLSNRKLPSPSSSHNIKINLFDMNVHIRVSNQEIGLILEKFIDKYNFENFVKFSMQQQRPQNAKRNGLKSSFGPMQNIRSQLQHSSQQALTSGVIEYEQDVLFRLKESAGEIDSPFFEDIKYNKENNLYKE